jgi:hypothetical protein
MVAMRMVRWLRRLTKSPVWRAFALGGYLLLLSASQLALIPGSGHFFRWVYVAVSRATHCLEADRYSHFGVQTSLSGVSARLESR